VVTKETFHRSMISECGTKARADADGRGEENHKDTKDTKNRKRILCVLCAFVVFFFLYFGKRNSMLSAAPMSRLSSGNPTSKSGR
jgi:hypothetical protein